MFIVELLIVKLFSLSISLSFVINVGFLKERFSSRLTRMTFSWQILWTNLAIALPYFLFSTEVFCCNFTPLLHLAVRKSGVKSLCTLLTPGMFNVSYSNS